MKEPTTKDDTTDLFRRGAVTLKLLTALIGVGAPLVGLGVALQRLERVEKDVAELSKATTSMAARMPQIDVREAQQGVSKHGDEPPEILVSARKSTPAREKEPSCSLLESGAFVTIDAPGNGTLHPKSLVVRGTAKRLSRQDCQLFLTINPEGQDGFWPQGGPIQVREGGAWSKEAWLGGKERDQAYTVAVVVANSVATDAFMTYLREGDRTGHYPSRPLPTGAEIVSSIIVRRSN